MKTVTADFDDLILQLQSLSDKCEPKFLEFVESNLACHTSSAELHGEVIRLQNELMKSEREISSMQMKLKNARQFLDEEKNRRYLIEKEKLDLEEQISMVMNMLGQGKIDETKEKLQILSNTLNLGYDSRRSDFKDLLSPVHHLSTISEDEQFDNMCSILSGSDIDLTNGEELDIFSKTRSGRIFHQSLGSNPNKSGQKRKSSERISPRKKSMKNDFEEKENRTTKQNLQTQEENNGGISAPSAPPVENHFDYTNVKATSYYSRTCMDQFATPLHTKMSHQQLGASVGVTQFNYCSSPLAHTYSSGTKLNQRPHTFASKVIYWTDYCQPCGKRLKFGKTAYKCKECRATCHVDCKDILPLPCIPTSNTPGKKGNQEHISDFTPLIPPMIPGLVIHCTNEIENKGLSEVGIYRVPGSDKDVKDLKEKFLRGKGIPNLSQVDIHVICGTLKDFLRSLKEPIVTYARWKDFVVAAEKTEHQDAIAGIYQAVSDLPRPNRDTLSWLILHLQRVAGSMDCKMPIGNLSKVFGPTIIGYSVPEPDPSTILNETPQQQIVMQKLLEISSVYWNSYLAMSDEPVNIIQTPSTPEVDHVTTTRRKSILLRTPLGPRSINTPRR